MAATIAASTALATSLALYTNSKLGLSSDIRTFRDQKITNRNLEAHVAKLGSHTTIYRMLELADPDADALWFEGKSWNYRALKAEVDNLALGLRELGVTDGAYVAVFMSNSPEMVFTIYALTKIGAVPSMINSALRDDTLLHCVRLPSASLIISSPDIAQFAAKAAQSLVGDIKVATFNLGSFRITEKLSPEVLEIPAPSATGNDEIIHPPRSISSVAALIYTSGTTGKPKACSIKNALVMGVSSPSAADTSNPTKYYPLRTYSCMPLFHGTTFFTGLCQSVGVSGCFCVSRKFSARNFWKEVTESRATRILYVGELLRFLLATPEGPYDRKHRVLVATGNGLQKDVWIAFQKRFHVPEIREFYRSTEGLVKYDNRHFGGEKGAGKVAYHGRLYRKLEKDQFIVKFDFDNEVPYRDPQTGFCVPAAINEPGEGIARIRSMPTYTNYHGNADATELKILRNVFEKGDMFQRAGDLLMHESTNYVRFVDRIGDTFRWRGENVSAGEIRGFIAELPGVQDVVVVGKKLSGYDGQAGVAAVRLDPSYTLTQEQQFMDSLYQQLKKKGIPAYAFPRLVAITDDIKVGDTFKHAKQIVKALVWGPEKNPDGKMFWLDGDRYRVLDAKSWGNIEAGSAKL